MIQRHQRYAAPHLEDEQAPIPNNMEEGPVFEQEPAPANLLLDNENMDIEPHDENDEHLQQLNEEDVEMLVEAFGQIEDDNNDDDDIEPLEEPDRPLNQAEMRLAIAAFGGDDDYDLPPHLIPLDDIDDEEDTDTEEYE